MSILATKEVAGPPLPRLVPGTEDKWHPATVKWWKSWRSSPQAAAMITGPDWDFLLQTAVIHHRFWTDGGDPKLAAELRLREGKFGATPEDRARLGLEIIMASKRGPFATVHERPTPATVDSLEARRRRILDERIGAEKPSSRNQKDA
jgi:hypothetical protein